MMTTPSSSSNSTRARIAAVILAGALGLITGSRTRADDAPPPPPTEDLARASAISGTLFIAGGGKIPEEILREFVIAAGGERAHLAVVTTASETADSIEVEPRIAFWRSQKFS